MDHVGLSGRIGRRRFAQRLASWSGAAAAGPLIAAACGASTTAQPQVAAPQQPAKLTLASKFGATERLQWATETTAKFNELNGPKITAEHIVLTGDALLAAIAAGTGPDVTLTNGSWFSDMSDKGALYDLTPFVKRDKVDMTRWYTLEEIFTYKGKQHGMPFWQAVSMSAYNATLFRRQNVALPNDTWTWDDLLDAAKRLTKPGETWGLQMSYGFEFAWLNFLRGAGADYINKERTKTTLNTPTAIDAMQWVQDLVLKHRVLAPPGDTSLGTGDLFLQGKVGINMTSVGFVGNARTAKPSFEWDFFVMPKHPKTGKRGGTVDDLPFVVTKDTKAPEAAWKLNLFIAEKFSQDLVGKYGLQMPSLKVSAADPQGWLAPPPATMKVSLEQVKFASTLSYHKSWMQWYGEVTNQMLPAFKGEKSIKEACDQASQIGDTLLRGV